MLRIRYAFSFSDRHKSDRGIYLDPNIEAVIPLACDCKASAAPTKFLTIDLEVFLLSINFDGLQFMGNKDVAHVFTASGCGCVRTRTVLALDDAIYCISEFLFCARRFSVPIQHHTDVTICNAEFVSKHLNADSIVMHQTN